MLRSLSTWASRCYSSSEKMNEGLAARTEYFYSSLREIDDFAAAVDVFCVHYFTSSKICVDEVRIYFLNPGCAGGR